MADCGELAFLVYRTSSAYERYNEGRRLFSQIIIGSRSLARLIWCHNPDFVTAPDPENPLSDDQKAREKVIARKEKRQAIELCLAFAVAVKHCEYTVHVACLLWMPYSF